VKVELIAVTDMLPVPEWVQQAGFRPVETNPATLIEMAGRNCYQSWSNPSGRTTEQYISNLIEHQHFSVLEHASATFLVSGVSRSFTHELVRHRHLSFSQLSQRYVDESESDFVIPPIIRGDKELEDLVLTCCVKCRETYKEIVRKLDDKLSKDTSMTKLERRKRAREAARSVLPNATETRIVVTGNFRAWREVLTKRLDPAADMEFQLFSSSVLDILNSICPQVFSDLKVAYSKNP